MEASRKFFCWGCLAAEDHLTLNTYTFSDSALSHFTNVGEIMLCFKCKRYAEITERFIENVRFAGALLHSLAPLTDLEIHDNICKARLQMGSFGELTASRVQTIDTSGADHSEGYTVLDFKAMVVKEEDCSESKVFDDEHFADNGDILVLADNDLDAAAEVKPAHLEAGFLEAVKCEVDLEDIKDEEFVPAGAKRRAKRKAKGGRSVKRAEAKMGQIKRRKAGATASVVQVVYLTPQQFADERHALSLEKRYASAAYRCERCVKGFTFRETHQRHLLKHAEESGTLECDVCGQRWTTDEQLVNHRAGHFKRYRCLACGVTRTSRLVIVEHHAAHHAPDVTFHCAHCDKSFLKRTLLKKHIAYAHRAKQRVVCQLCDKTYVNNDALRSHMLLKHAPADAPLRREHCCAQCPRAFRSPSHLRAHLAKHSESREYYCVECDRHFKTDAILKQHLKVAQPHVGGRTLPLGCEHCERRFSVRRELERHVNKLHLRVKPHQCDRCAKAYASSWSLQEHKKLTHEGYRLPLRFPCTMCDKVFTRSMILREHMRTHTGERPFQCPKCPATFAQSGVLHTHNRLIHLKLQRNGAPKRGPAASAAGGQREA